MDSPIEGLRWNRFTQFGKRSFHPDAGGRIEADGFLEGEGKKACDYLLEFKDWERTVGLPTAEEFLPRKSILEGLLSTRTGSSFTLGADSPMKQETCSIERAS